MEAIGKRRSVQLGSLIPREAESAQQTDPATVEAGGPDFTRSPPVTIHCEQAGAPVPLTAGACEAAAGKRVLAQAAMVRIIMRFLTARELLAFARAAHLHLHRHAVTAELGQRSHGLDTQYTALFDEYRSLHSQFAALSACRAPVDQLRMIRDRVKALGIEMDDKLQGWEEIQRAWDDAGIGEPKPVLTRDESYLG